MVTLTVNGMNCGHCEKAVVNALIDLGVSTAIASHKTNTVEIEYDPTVVTLEAIKAEIIEIGYTCG